MSTWISTHTLALVTGAVLGASGPLLLSTGGQAGNAAHLTLSAGWAWAALAFLIGIFGRTKIQSASAGTTALVCAVLAYYLTKAGQGEYVSADLNDLTGQTTYFDWGVFISKLLAWFFFAFLLGPLLGFAGNLARNGPYRLVFRLPVPLVVLVETSMRMQNEAAMQGQVATTTWSVTRMVAVIALVAIIVLSLLGNWRHRRGASRA
ncbi:DUF6518 family protein [Streptomyces sp. 8N706]|uniref:DUF6518 family protein n=1 Tax=Streptomyces sp. 8N706 TaxID=3457416 RepID=UPI003FCFA049